MKKTIIATLTGIVCATLLSTACTPNNPKKQQEVQKEIFTTQLVQKTVNVIEVRENSLLYALPNNSVTFSQPIEVIVGKDPEGIKGYLLIGVKADLHRGAARITYKKFKNECVHEKTLLQAMVHSQVTQSSEWPQDKNICAEGVITEIKYE